jgi:hypothetical protein
MLPPRRRGFGGRQVVQQSPCYSLCRPPCCRKRMNRAGQLATGNAAEAGTCGLTLGARTIFRSRTARPGDRVSTRVERRGQRVDTRSRLITYRERTLRRRRAERRLGAAGSCVVRMTGGAQIGLFWRQRGWRAADPMAPWSSPAEPWLPCRRRWSRCARQRGDPFARYGPAPIPGCWTAGSSGRAWRDSRCRAVRDPAQVRNPVRLHGGRVLSANACAYGGIDELAL